MWADAQHDGRPAEYRWRPLFDAAKFGWRALLECRAVTLRRRETRWNLLGVSQTHEAISAVSGPKFAMLWRHVEEVLLFNKFFFSDCRYIPYLRRYSWTKLCDCAQMAQSCAMVRRWRIFGDFLRPLFSASRVQHVSDLLPKFALRPHHGGGGLRFSLSLIVSQLWRHQWRHNDVISRFAKVVVERCGLHPRPWTIVA